MTYYALWALVALSIWAYLVLGIIARIREEQYRYACPYGVKAAISTILFWPYKAAVVFYRKWKRNRG